MNIAIIPARGGSKRIPRKNIKPFLGKPMISYSIEAAQNSTLFDSVLVSTDDQEIAQISQDFGAEIPFLRPAELADDFADTLSVVKHTLLFLQEQGQLPEYVCCIYATAPFISATVLQAAYRQLLDTQADYVFSAAAFDFPVQRGFVLTPNQRSKMLFPDHFGTRSQDLPAVFHDAGQFYWGKAAAFLEKYPVFTEKSSPFVLSSMQVQDIDTLDDWQIAEFKYQYWRKKGKQ